MSSASYFVTPRQLWSMIGTAQPPVILDLRRRNISRGRVAWLPRAAEERHDWSARAA